MSQARRVFYRSLFQCQPFFSFFVSVPSTQTTIRLSLKGFNDDLKTLQNQHANTCSLRLLSSVSGWCLKRGGEFYRPPRRSQHLHVKKFQNDENSRRLRSIQKPEQQQATSHLLLFIEVVYGMYSFVLLINHLCRSAARTYPKGLQWPPTSLRAHTILRSEWTLKRRTLYPPGFA